MRAIVLALLLALAGQAWGATYYLDTSCTNNGNGTGAAGECAAFAGAAGAYNTGASIIFGAGDTIFIKRGTTVTNFPSPVSQAVTIDDYGSTSLSCPVISKSSTFALSLSAAGVTINDICLTGDNTSAILNISAANASLNRIEVYGNTTAGAIGVRFNSGSGGSSMTDSSVHHIADDGIGLAATIASGTITITNQNCRLVDTDNLTGDCLQGYTGTAAGLTISGGTWVRETANKQAIIYDGSGAVLIKDRPQIDVSGGSQGVQIAGTGTFDLTSAYVYGGASSSKLLQIVTTGTTNISGFIGYGGVDGIYVSHASGTVNVRNSTVTGASNSALYHTTGGTLNAYNNYLDGAVATLLDASAGATTVANYNRYGRAKWQWDGAAITSLATWQSTSSQDANSAVASDPGFIGGATPDSAEGFCLESDSPLIGAGVNLGQQVFGYAGEDMLNTLSIGARGPCRMRPTARTRATH